MKLYTLNFKYALIFLQVQRWFGFGISTDAKRIIIKILFFEIDIIFRKKLTSN